MNGPNKDLKFPLDNYDRLCFLKNVITNPNIVVGDYTYYDDFENVENFEKNVKYLFDFSGDKLIIGKFCISKRELFDDDAMPPIIFLFFRRVMFLHPINNAPPNLLISYVHCHPLIIYAAILIGM